MNYVDDTDGWVDINAQLPSQDGEYLCAVVIRFDRPPVVKTCSYNTSTDRFNLWPLRVIGWRPFPAPPQRIP